MIKTIEAHYKGYRFRNCLEARWAIFFDALNLKWDYEPEGFELPEVGPYIPDFYVHGLNQWVEVKPDGSDYGKVRAKLEAFVHLSGNSLLIAEGVPCVRSYDLLYSKTVQENEAQEGLRRGCVVEEVCFNRKYLPPINHDEKPRLFGLPGCIECDADCLDAIHAARSARFELSEIPKGV